MRGIKIAGITGNVITLAERSDADRLRGIGQLAIYGPSGIMRTGGLFYVACVNPDVGTVVAMDSIQALIPTACAGDMLKAAPHDTFSVTTDDHAALVAYLLSAVRRADWHAVSDAANDLRVLEAKRG